MKAISAALALLVVSMGAACRAPGPQTNANAICVALAVDPGVVSRDVYAHLLRSALYDVVVDGGTVHAWRATVSAVSPVPLPLAGPGARDLVIKKTPGSAARRERAAERRVDEIVTGLLDVVANAESSPAGSSAEHVPPVDLFGTLRVMGSEAARMTDCIEKQATLVTGGGIHRGGDADLLDIDGAGTSVTRETAETVGTAIEPITAPSGVRLRTYGVGHFEGVKPEIAPSFADGILRIWKAKCVAPCLVD